MIGIATALAACALAALDLLRLFAGPTLYDRALAGAAMVVKAAIVCAAVAVGAGQPQLLDVAMLLVFSAILLAVAALRFFKLGSFQAPLTGSGDA
jgi:multicomponent Na+:H+ antiporter subunit F